MNLNIPEWNKNIQDTLFDILQPTNNSNSVVCNSEFNHWEDHINDRVIDRNLGREYSLNKDASSLLEHAKEHIKTYSNSIETPIWITLTHPLYMVFSHSAELTSPKVIKDAQNYLDNLVGLLTSEIPRDKASIVLIETLHHYTAATSRLLEQGLVDYAIISKYDDGTPLDSEELRAKQGQKYICGGAYNKKCFKASLDSIWNEIDNPSRINIIKDLVIDSPQYRSDGLKPKEIIWPHDIHPRKEITLKDLYKKFE